MPQLLELDVSDNRTAALHRRPTGAASIAFAMALSVAMVVAAPDQAFAGKGGANNGHGGGSGSSTETSSGNKGNNKGVGNAGGNSGNSGGGDAASSGSGSSSSSGGSTSGGGVTTVSLPACSLSDLVLGAGLCSGYFQGNLLSNSSADLTAQTAGLTAIGLADWDGQLVEGQLNLTGPLVDFATLLNGVTFIGVHYGAGAGGPSPQTPGGVTAFYRFDAGTNLDSFRLTPGAVSAARLYATGPAPLPPAPPPLEPLRPPTGLEGAIEGIGTAVPEPTTWALMILGFGAAGAALRRRRRLAAV